MDKPASLFPSIAFFEEKKAIPDSKLQVDNSSISENELIAEYIQPMIVAPKICASNTFNSNTVKKYSPLQKILFKISCLNCILQDTLCHPAAKAQIKFLGFDRQQRHLRKFIPNGITKKNK
jgi:hypothetical protein